MNLIICIINNMWYKHNCFTNSENVFFCMSCRLTFPVEIKFCRNNFQNLSKILQPHKSLRTMTCLKEILVQPGNCKYLSVRIWFKSTKSIPSRMAWRQNVDEVWRSVLFQSCSANIDHGGNQCCPVVVFFLQWLQYCKTCCSNCKSTSQFTPYSTNAWWCIPGFSIQSIRENNRWFCLQSREKNVPYFLLS